MAVSETIKQLSDIARELVCNIDELEAQYQGCDNFDFIHDTDDLTLEEHGIMLFPTDKNHNPISIHDTLCINNSYDARIADMTYSALYNEWDIELYIPSSKKMSSKKIELTGDGYVALFAEIVKEV